MVGYRRFEGLEAAAALARLYAAMRLFVNFFQPSFKLAEKARDGARVRKRYHPPATPCQRLLADPRTPDEVRGRMNAMAQGLDPVGLLREIRATQQHGLLHLDGVAPEPVHLPRHKGIASPKTSEQLPEARAIGDAAQLLLYEPSGLDPSSRQGINLQGEFLVFAAYAGIAKNWHLGFLGKRVLETRNPDEPARRVRAGAAHRAHEGGHRGRQEAREADWQASGGGPLRGSETPCMAPGTAIPCIRCW